jgi:hypothetical protein
MLTAVSLALTIVYAKKIYKDVSKRKRLSAKYFLAVPLLFYRNEWIKLAASSSTREDGLNDISYKLKKNHHNHHHHQQQQQQQQYQINERKTRAQKPVLVKSASLSYGSLMPKKSQQSVHFSLNNDKYYYYSRSANELNEYGRRERNNGSSKVDKEPTATSSYLCNVFKRESEASRRRYDFIKQLQQRIKLQFIVIELFIICWLPLFITVAVDAKFEVSPTVYRYLTMLAFANSSLTPYCYLTILVPACNKYCLPFLRTDGRQSKEKTQMYDAIEQYYEKLGDRLHNMSTCSSISGSSSSSSSSRCGSKSSNSGNSSNDSVNNSCSSGSSSNENASNDSESSSSSTSSRRDEKFKQSRKIKADDLDRRRHSSKPAIAPIISKNTRSNESASLLTTRSSLSQRTDYTKPSSLDDRYKNEEFYSTGSKLMPILDYMRFQSRPLVQSQIHQPPPSKLAVGAIEKRRRFINNRYKNNTAVFL